MEMERINENTIRVLIGNEDLTERGITVLDLLGNHQQIESFFYSILEEVDTDHQFQDNDSVTFQVLPNRNGLELFISKNNMEDFDEDDQQPRSDQKDEVSDFLKRQLGQTDRDDRGNRRTAVANDEVEDAVSSMDFEKSVTVLKLGEFENVIQVARLLHLDNATSNLYLYKDEYYLEIIFFVEYTSPETMKDDLAIAYEYGEKSRITADVLAEHGTRIMADSALELIRHYFDE